MIYKFNITPIKIQTFVGRKRKFYPKIDMKHQGTPNSENNIEKDEQEWQAHTF